MSDSRQTPTGIDLAAWLLSDQGCACDNAGECNICLIVDRLQQRDALLEAAKAAMLGITGYKDGLYIIGRNAVGLLRSAIAAVEVQS